LAAEAGGEKEERGGGKGKIRRCVSRTFQAIWVQVRGRRKRKRGRRRAFKKKGRREKEMHWPRSIPPDCSTFYLRIARRPKGEEEREEKKNRLGKRRKGRREE